MGGTLEAGVLIMTDGADRVAPCGQHRRTLGLFMTAIVCDGRSRITASRMSAWRRAVRGAADDGRCRGGASLLIVWTEKPIAS